MYQKFVRIRFRPQDSLVGLNNIQKYKFNYHININSI